MNPLSTLPPNSEYPYATLAHSTESSFANADISFINKFGKVGDVIFANFSQYNVELIKKASFASEVKDSYFIRIGSDMYQIKSYYIPRTIIVENADNHLNELKIVSNQQHQLAWILNPEKKEMEETVYEPSPKLANLVTIDEVPMLNLTQEAKVSFNWSPLGQHMSCYTLTINERQVQLPIAWHDSSYRILIENHSQPEAFKITVFNSAKPELKQNIFIYDAQQNRYIPS